MTFILAAQRDGSPAEMIANFKRYQAFLEGSRSRFPPGAHALATSAWYYNFEDHRCPHDAWLEAATIRESVVGEPGERRTVALEIRLLDAYHDGHISFHYPQVFAYRHDAWDSGQAHQDWRYDEFRLSDPGHVLHEIEWAGRGATSRWLIEASDVHMTWEPLSGSG